MSKPVKKKTRTKKSLGRAVGGRRELLQGSRTGTTKPVTFWYQNKEVPGLGQQGERLGVVHPKVYSRKDPSALLIPNYIVLSGTQLTF